MMSTADDDRAVNQMSKPFHFFSQSNYSTEDLFDGKFVPANPPESNVSVNEFPVPLRNYSGQYWFVQLPYWKHKALTSLEIAAVLHKHLTVRSISGLFVTGRKLPKALNDTGKKSWKEMENDCVFSGNPRLFLGAPLHDENRV